MAKLLSKWCFRQLPLGVFQARPKIASDVPHRASLPPAGIAGNTIRTGRRLRPLAAGISVMGSFDFQCIQIPPAFVMYMKAVKLVCLHDHNNN
jgi:hypothetical protein